MTEDDGLPSTIAESLLGLIPGIGAVLAPWGARLTQTVAREHQRQVSKALAAAERVSGRSREDLGDAIADDPALVPLLTRLLYAAGTSGYDRTLLAMGAALGEAVADRGKIDDAELILSGMTNLGKRDFQLLATLADVPPPPEENGNLTLVMPPALAETTGIRVELVETCLRNLAGSGLVTTKSAFIGGGTGYLITELGTSVLAVIDELDIKQRRA